mmetsp:Transcript_27039/g.81854  ORF Transcript_27039/g.81854 Transcript_27039/m.81854 type:complete len:150 (+) Transcript_27039:37-486(+)
MSCCLPSSGVPSGLRFVNSANTARGDSSIPSSRRVYFAIFFPESEDAQPAYFFFDRTKPTLCVVEQATRYAGLQMDRGRLAGSPEKLNLFTIEGEVLRTDLEIDAHLGGALHPSSVLLLEKGNRVSESRLETIRQAAALQTSGSVCVLL